MPALIVALLVFLMAGFAPARAARPEPLPEDIVERIEAEVERLMTEKDVPAYAVAVVGADGARYAGHFGMSDRKQRRRATKDTLYNIGSTTKTFTAALILILRDDGRLALDDIWSKYMPDKLPIPVDEDGNTSTIRNLMTHTSGLERDPPHRKSGVSEKDLYRVISNAELEGPVGERWEYSNLGYGLLGHVAERATNQDFEVLLKAQLLRPLDMKDTTISLTIEQKARLAPHYWADDPQRRERRGWKWTDIVANGGMTSSLADMVRYVSYLLGPEDAPGPLTADIRREMFEPIEEHEQPAMKQLLGWFGTNQTGKGLWYSHGGEVDGHSAHVSFSPPLGFGVVVLSNLGGDAAASLGRTVEQVLYDTMP